MNDLKNTDKIQIKHDDFYNLCFNADGSLTKFGFYFVLFSVVGFLKRL